MSHQVWIFERIMSNICQIYLCCPCIQILTYITPRYPYPHQYSFCQTLLAVCFSSSLTSSSFEFHVPGRVPRNCIVFMVNPSLGTCRAWLVVKETRRPKILRTTDFTVPIEFRSLLLDPSRNSGTLRFNATATEKHQVRVYARSSHSIPSNELYSFNLSSN